MVSGGISVLGLGLMGAAIASGFARAGHAVTGWNRTYRERPDLASSGVKLAADSTAAVAVSELVVIVVLDYDAAVQVLEGAGPLSGKTIVPMCSGIPRQARALGESVRGRGGQYLDGAIKMGPSDIGDDRGAIVYAGASPVFNRHKAALSALGGQQVYLGADEGAAKGFEMATYARSYPWLYGYFEAVAVARQFGIGTREATDLMMAVVGSTFRYIERAVAQIENDDYPPAEHASVSVHHAGLLKAIAAAKEEGLNTPLLDVIAAYMEQTIASGLGDSDIAACYRAVAADRRAKGGPS